MRFVSRSKAGPLLFLIGLVIFVSMLVVGGIFQAYAARAASTPFIGPFHTVTSITSTVPGNGDVNPYGLVVVPRSIGKLVKGDVLISNFNNNVNLPAGQQGRGSTIVEISPSGTLSLFAQIDPNNLHGSCPGGVGLTTALVVLKRGWVIVGSLPTKDGMSATMKAGCLIVLNSHGQVVETFAGNGINGPWDMTARDRDSKAQLFVTNVLNGTLAASPNVVNQGTVLRIELTVPKDGDGKPARKSTTVIGSGFSERTDPASLVVGPTGVGLGSDGTLYVADSVNSRISAIPDAVNRDSTAFTGNDVTANGGVNDPLGLAIAPNGDILTVNGGDGNIVETTPDGNQVAVRLLDNTPPTPTGGAGTLFGVAVIPGGSGVYFVDDGDNTFRLLH
jgi:hypothetical protein